MSGVHPVSINLQQSLYLSTVYIPYLVSSHAVRKVWLDPVHIPSSSALTCSHCQDPLSFLLQVY